MNERWRELAERIDNLEPKERVLVLIAAVLVLGMAWQRFAMQPLEEKQLVLESQLAQIQGARAEFDAEAVRIVEVSQLDPNAPLRQQIDRSVDQTREFEHEIRERAGQLISPQEMPQVLQSVLQETRGLEFVSLEGLGAEPLLPRGKQDAGTPTGAGAEGTAYRHGVRIRFNGSYLDTLAYLRALETLPWRFFWDAVDIEVKDHPTAAASIVVYTLSLDRRWIGV